MKAFASYPELVLSDNHLTMLVNAVDAVFPKFSVRIIERYPRLKRSDVMVAGLGGNITWQIIVFAVVSLLTFIFLRPFMLKFLDRKSKDVKTNADALVGRKAIVSERIDATQHTGRVAVDGDDWKAVSADGSVIEKGTEVEIVKLDSIILTVKQ